MNDISFWENSISEGFYDNTISEGMKRNRDIQSQWHDITYKSVLREIDPKHKVLDYACGPGTFVGRYLIQPGFGTDIINKQVDYAKKFYGIENNFFYLSQDNLKKNAPFDVITLLGLVEFLNYSEISQLFETIKDISNNGTQIIITTPNYGSLMKYIEKVANKIGDVNYSDVNVSDFNEKNIYEVLENIGLVDIKVTKVVNFGVFFSLINNKLGSFINKVISKTTQNKFGYILLVKAIVKK